MEKKGAGKGERIGFCIASSFIPNLVTALPTKVQYQLGPTAVVYFAADEVASGGESCR